MKIFNFSRILGSNINKPNYKDLIIIYLLNTLLESINKRALNGNTTSILTIRHAAI